VKIICRTLIDITRTNVNSRRNRLDTDGGVNDIVKRRGQQSNFETILQVISMRAQPEDITDPEKAMKSLKDEDWGTEYRNSTKVPVWEFSFTVAYEEVFSNGTDKLAFLVEDCTGVPVITKLDEWAMVQGKLDTTPQWKNITFRIDHDSQ
jgi:hypothetical protein